MMKQVHVVVVVIIVVSIIDYTERPRIGEVRLAPPTDGFNGVIELYYNISDSNNTWSNICYGSSNDQTIADTVCTQLGYTDTAAGYSSV